MVWCYICRYLWYGAVYAVIYGIVLYMQLSMVLCYICSNLWYDAIYVVICGVVLCYYAYGTMLKVEQHIQYMIISITQSPPYNQSKVPSQAHKYQNLHETRSFDQMCLSLYFTLLYFVCSYLWYGAVCVVIYAMVLCM